MEIVTLNHQAGLNHQTVHHTQEHKIFSKNQTMIITTIILVILDHNHLIIVEIEIFHDDNSHAIVSEVYEIY